MSHTPTDLNGRCVFHDHWNDRTVVIACAGELDMLTAPDFERRIAEALEKQPTAVVIDLTDVDFLASAGMRVLVETNDTLSGTVDFAVVADGPFTHRPMSLVGISDLFAILPTLQGALDHLAEREYGSSA